MKNLTKSHTVVHGFLSGLCIVTAVIFIYAGLTFPSIGSPIVAEQFRLTAIILGVLGACFMGVIGGFIWKIREL
jgi:hypothetical protein